MDMEQCWFLCFFNEVCGGDVCQDYVFFNQFMCIVMLSLFDMFNMVFGIEDEFSFFIFK